MINLIELINHFFRDNSPLEYKNKLITFNSFINNFHSLEKMLINKKDYKEDIDKLDITEERFYLLYKSNDKIINYIKTLNYKKIILLGTNTEMLINYFNLYDETYEIKICNDIEEYINYLKEEVLIIDINSSIIKLKQLIYDNNSLVYDLKSKLISLKEICDYAEYLYFINNIYKNKNLKVYIYNYPDIDEYKNLTDNEKVRIAFDHHYRYYYDRYKTDKSIDKILRKVFKELYSDEFILSRNYLPNIYLKKGRCYLEDSDNKYCMSINGCRRTLYQNYNSTYDINIFGPCVVFGALEDDENTIPSIMQKLINKNHKDYKVNNYGARAIDFSENLRTTADIILKKNDVLIYIINKEEKLKLKSLGFNKVKKLNDVFNDKNLKDYFIDEPIHCNHIANKKITEYIYKDINKDLIDIGNNETYIINENKNNKIFINNKLLDDYIDYLNTFKKTKGKAGCIVMNCNPFTNGHLNLIKYAANKVDLLYVIVVKEDKSYFKFKDRFEMVKRGCEELDNVEVLHSGNIFVSSMTFPEYFNKEDKSNIEIDVSLDREIFTDYIAPTLGITVRFLGEEKNDIITNYLNEDLKRYLPLKGIDVEIVPRFKSNSNIVISAKTVRKTLKEKDYELLKELVPKTTYDYLLNMESNMNFLSNKINGNLQEYLDNINEKSICIYSKTSKKKCNIEFNNKNIKYISTDEITKNVEKIEEYIKTFNDIKNVITFGGGTATDIGKYISNKLNNKLISIPSMLSTNAYSTNKVALLTNGLKITLEAKEPDVILLDKEVLNKSHSINIYGLADILSIHTALKDWDISIKYNNEVKSSEYDEARLLLNEIKEFILKNDTESIKDEIDKVYEFIGRSGEITNKYGSGKPESGSEHIFAKVIESKINIPHGLAISHGIILMSVAQDNIDLDIINCIKKLDLINESKKYNITSNLIKECLDEVKIREDRFSIINIIKDKETIFNKYYDLVWRD